MQDCVASSNNIHEVLVFVNTAEKAFSPPAVAHGWKKLTQEDNTRHNTTVTPSHFFLPGPGKGLVSTAQCTPGRLPSYRIIKNLYLHT